MHRSTGPRVAAAAAAALLCLAFLATTSHAGTGSLECTSWKIPSTARLPDSPPTRAYYISADVVPHWSYTPLGNDNCNSYTLEHATDTVQKAIFTEFDADFLNQRARPAEERHLGILGPIIRAEEGDLVEVTLRNNLPFPINLEPSGFLYAEPAPAQTGDTVTYRWVAPNSTAACSPLKDSSSQMWHYRSTVDPPGHNNAGLFGPIVIMRRGSMDPATMRPAGIDRELFAVFQRFDDSLNPLEGDEALPDPQMPHTINGISWCNLPDMDANYGDRVRWYVLGLGNEDDVHTPHWHGVTVSRRSQRNVDSLFIVPGVAETVDSIADNPGTWLFHCHVNHHLGFGMGALYTIKGDAFATAPGPAAGGRVRTYYIQSEIVTWDYAPSNANQCNNPPTPFSGSELIFTTPVPKQRLSKEVLKAQYIQYTDATFTKPVKRTAAEAHLGIQGPTIYAEVGDLIQVVFRNAIPGHAVSVHAHGVLYAKDAEGAPYNDGTHVSLKLDDIVQFGATYTYRWYVPERAGPGPNDPSSIMWMYHSHTDEAMDTWAGLFGSIIITRQGSARGDGTPKDVDRHLVLTWSVLDESASFLLCENAVQYLEVPLSTCAKVAEQMPAKLPFIPDGPTVQQGIVLEELLNATPGLDVDDFLEANKKHSINGFFFCNLPGLDAQVAQRTRVYFQAFGDAIDLHSPTLFSSAFIEDGRPSQAVKLLPGYMSTTDLIPAAAGSWILQCSVMDHLVAGMRARLTLKGGPNPDQLAKQPAARTYYIAAEKDTWDYAPLRHDGCSGEEFTPEQALYTEQYIGRQYVKARYIQYDGPGFAKKVAQPEQNGILGPVIAAEAGEIIDIVFKNAVEPSVAVPAFKPSLKFLSGFVPVGVVVNGKLLAGPNAALQYLDGGVHFGATVTFRWFVPPASAKADTRLGLAAYTYLSGVNEVTHTHAGLMGLALVGAPGRFPTKATSAPAGVPGADFFYPLILHIFNENESPFLQESIEAAPGPVDPAADDFGEANLKHSVNGRLYCNLDPLLMTPEQQGVVVVAGTGSENGMHSPIFEGQALEEDGDGILVPGLIPAVTRVATVVAGVARPNWRAYCYVHDHLIAGMVIRVDTTGEGAAIVPPAKP